MKYILLVLIVLILTASILPPARVHGYIMPPDCRHNEGIITIYNFIGQTLSVYVDGVIAAETVIEEKDGKAHYIVYVPMETSTNFAHFVVNGFLLGGTEIHAGENLRADFCGQMPVIMLRHLKTGKVK